MKNYISILISTLLLLSLCSCGPWQGPNYDPNKSGNTVVDGLEV